MIARDGLPQLHFIMLDEVETPEGWRVWCLRHGSLGAYLSPVQATLIGMRHDTDSGLQEP